MKPTKFKSELQSRAAKLGFDACRITSADLPEGVGNNLFDFIAQSRHGTMEWMETTKERRRKPTAMWAQAKSAIILGMNYGPSTNPLAALEQRNNGTISVYAQNRDYHNVVKGKLKELAGWLASRTGQDVKVFVDTAPLMEKPLAEQAGLGWQGKHTNLVSRDHGSWLFLGAILTEAELTADTPETDHCGSCTACLEVCPTDAFPAPYQLDARRCISYLTIEHSGPIPVEFRAAMGNRIYGCDDCLAVCPWNKYASVAKESKLQARKELQSPSLAELCTLDETGFRILFSQSPVKRIGHARFSRNVLIAIGNSENPEFIPFAGKKLNAKDPMVRGAAVWALGRLEDHEQFTDMKLAALETEADPLVRAEWDAHET